MSDLTHFDMIPLQLDPSTGAVLPPTSKPPRALAAELDALNALHAAVLSTPEGVTPHGVPLPPVPVKPARTANINKLREQANAEFRKSRHAEAEKLYTLALGMALDRPLWEPSGLVREEVAALLANRAQARVSMGRWPEGAVDAEASIEMKRQGNPKAWWRRAKCLMEMGRVDEAREWVGKAMDIEGREADLVALAKEIEERKDKLVSS